MTSLPLVVASIVRADEPERMVTWREIVLHRNSAPLPSPHPGADTMWNRGFDFLVVDGSGKATHFGRCRSSSDARAARASEIREQLANDPALDGIVPQTRSRHAGELLVELSRYVSGTPFELEVADLDSDVWAADTRQILNAVRRVTENAADRIPSLRTEAQVDLSVAAAPALEYLGAAGLSAERCDTIRATIAAGGRLPTRLQHGDLWPGNVLRSDGSFVLLDYEVFGDVRVPLYDVFHFLRTCMLQRGGAGGPSTMLDILQGTAADVETCRSILREEGERDGLSRRQVLAAFAFYLADMAAKGRGRAGPEEYWRPYWLGLERLADMLGAGGPIEDLLLGDPSAPVVARTDEPSHFERVGRHGLIYALGILLGRAVAFVMLPVYTRFLTPADYGIYQLVELTFEVVSIVAGIRLNAGVFHFYHKARGERERREMLSTTMLLMVFSFALATALAYLAAPELSTLVFGVRTYAYLVRIGSVSLFFQSLFLVPFAYLQARERSWLYVAVNAVKLVIQLSLNIVLLVGFHMRARGVLLSALAGNVVIGVWMAGLMLRQVGIHFSLRACRDVIRFSAPLVVSQVGTFISTYADRFFLQRAASATIVGLYGLAYQFGFLLATVGYMPWTGIWGPMQFEIAKRPDRDRLYARAFIYMNLLLLTVAVIIALSVFDFLRVMSNHDFLPAAIIVPIILVAYVLQVWSEFHSVGLLVTENTAYVTMANLVAAGVALAFYALLIPRYFGFGAAIATVIAFGVRSIIVFVTSQRLWPIRYEWGPVIRLTLLATAVVSINTAVPVLPLAQSLGVHVFLMILYLAGVWRLGILTDGDRTFLRRLLRSPRGAVADLRALLLERPG